MAGSIHYSFGFLALLICALSLPSSVSSASIRPIADAHRAAALNLFLPIDGSFPSLEETYEALETFRVLGIKQAVDLSRSTCPTVVDTLGSSSSTAKDRFHALRVHSLLKCQIGTDTLEPLLQGTALKLQDVLKRSDSLLDFYYSIGGLLLIKREGLSVALSDADGLFHSIKALSQSNGRWLYASGSSDESSNYAAGIAIETLAGVISLSNSQVDRSAIGIVKKDILKLFDSARSYNDGTLYFDDKNVVTNEFKGPITTTASVVRGITAFAAVSSGKLSIPGDKVLGLAKFFLSLGIPGSARDFFNQIDALSCLEYNMISKPLVVSLPSTVLSLTSRDQLKVEVATVFGSSPPALKVALVEAFSSDSEIAPVLEGRELQFDKENNIHYLDVLPLKLDVGKYTFVFEVSFEDPDLVSTYATGGRTKTSAFLTGTININKAEIKILNGDSGSIETTQKLDLSKDSTISLQANHLQKLQLSFQLTTSLGRSFNPHQVFLKLRHETKVEHIFLVEGSARQHKAVLDFLGLVEKFYYLSGKYDIELTVGDVVMENSFMRILGHVELDLPEAPEKAARPPTQIDPYLRFGPKQEISHIFRSPEKRPPKELSYAFLCLTLLPLIGFLIGLVRLGVNLRGFPSSTVPGIFSLLFHAGIGAVLLLYVLFWLKLDLFTTLKTLGFIGAFLVFAGHGTLSHLANSAKLKSS